MNKHIYYWFLCFINIYLMIFGACILYYDLTIHMNIFLSFFNTIKINLIQHFLCLQDKNYDKYSKFMSAQDTKLTTHMPKH